MHPVALRRPRSCHAPGSNACGEPGEVAAGSHPAAALVACNPLSCFLSMYRPVGKLRGNRDNRVLRWSPKKMNEQVVHDIRSHTIQWPRDAVFYHIYPLGCLGAPVRNPFHGPPSDRISLLSAWIDYLVD